MALRFLLQTRDRAFIGGSQHVGYEEWVELDSVEWSSDRVIGISPKAAEVEVTAPEIGPIRVSKRFDLATAALASQFLSGKAIDLTLVGIIDEEQPTELLRVELTRAVIESQSLSGGDELAEVLSIRFAAFVATTPALEGQPDRLVRSWGWDLQQAKPKTS